MVVDNPYDPSPDSVRVWMYSGESWPVQDWDLMVANGLCDEVVLDCARDNQCPKQKDAIEMLYVISGDVIYSSLGDKRKIEVSDLAKSISESDSEQLQQWRIDTLRLLGGEIELDYDFWFFRDVLSF